jgi:hypothetical protein
MPLAAKNTVFLVTGADKAPAVGNVFNREFDPKHYPAQLISRQGKRGRLAIGPQDAILPHDNNYCDLSSRTDTVSEL